jgi:hypothetical protein
VAGPALPLCPRAGPACIFRGFWQDGVKWFSYEATGFIAEPVRDPRPCVTDMMSAITRENPAHK